MKINFHFFGQIFIFRFLGKVKGEIWGVSKATWQEKFQNFRIWNCRDFPGFPIFLWKILKWLIFSEENFFQKKMKKVFVKFLQAKPFNWIFSHKQSWNSQFLTCRICPYFEPTESRFHPRPALVLHRPKFRTLVGFSWNKKIQIFPTFPQIFSDLTKNKNLFF